VNEALSSVLQASLDKFRNHEARVAVIGLGYVGLPLAVEFASAGFLVLGFDVVQTRVESINLGKSPVLDVSDSALADVISSGKFRASVLVDDLADIDAFIICVPTPLRKTKEPDISYVISATESIRLHLRVGQLIVLESTTYPGTTDELILGMLEDGSGLKADRDFFLAFSPERVDPGNPTFSTKNITKVVGGIGLASTQLAVALYSQVLEKVHAVSSARVAETAKLLENTFRAVNIGLVNELAMLCHKLNIDVWEVVNAAATKPFGFMPFYPGPGIGGHCIPLDPHYLAWRARLSGFDPRFIGLADQVNSHMPQYVVSRISDLLNNVEKSLKGSKILVFGVAYKADIDDSRESPALEVIHFLRERGAFVRYADSFISHVAIGLETFEAVSLTEEVLEWADLGVILTGHSDFDWSKILISLRMVFDTRNTIKIQSEKVVRL
jgi:UDP-N-acetyl-D-glucosamine dehydrogenase